MDEYQLDDEQKKHMFEVLDRFNKRFVTKWKAGHLEHGGKLWVKEDNLDQAFDELVDLVAYIGIEIYRQRAIMQMELVANMEPTERINPDLAPNEQ